MMKKSATILSLILLSLSFSLRVNSEARDIPEDNLAYPVHIRIIDVGEASGIYVTSSTFTYLVTARHVFCSLAPSIRHLPQQFSLRTTSYVELTSYTPVQDESCKNKLRLNIRQLLNDGRIAIADDDVMIIQVMKVTPQDDARMSAIPGVEIISQCKSGFVVTPITTTRRFEDVFIGNEAVAFGYPNSIGLKDVPQIDYERPLLKRGIIAGKNRALKTIIFDSPVYPGNSGGPILQVERTAKRIVMHVVGVASELIPFEGANIGIARSNSTYSVVEPMDSVWRLISKMENTSLPAYMPDVLMKSVSY